MSKDCYKEGSIREGHKNDDWNWFYSLPVILSSIWPFCCYHFNAFSLNGIVPSFLSVIYFSLIVITSPRCAMLLYLIV